MTATRRRPRLRRHHEEEEDDEEEPPPLLRWPEEEEEGGDDDDPDEGEEGEAVAAVEKARGTCRAREATTLAEDGAASADSASGALQPVRGMRAAVASAARSIVSVTMTKGDLIAEVIDDVVTVGGSGDMQRDGSNSQPPTINGGNIQAMFALR